MINRALASSVRTVSRCPACKGVTPPRDVLRPIVPAPRAPRRSCRRVYSTSEWPQPPSPLVDSSRLSAYTSGDESVGALAVRLESEGIVPEGVVQAVMDYIAAQPSSASKSSPQASHYDTVIHSENMSASLKANLLYSMIKKYGSTGITPLVRTSIARLALHKRSFIKVVELLVDERPDDTSDVALIISSLAGRVDLRDLRNVFDEIISTLPNSIEDWHPSLWKVFIDVADFRMMRSALSVYQKMTVVRLERMRQEKQSIPYNFGLSVAQLYTVALTKWINEVVESESGLQRTASEMPCELARELCGIIGEKHLPISFLNYWMNAERVAENYTTSGMIFDLLYLTPISDAKARTDAYSQIDWSRGAESPGALNEKIQRLNEEKAKNRDRPRANSHTWRIYFKMHKSLPEPPPLRDMVKIMLANLRRREITPDLLNPLLSAILSKTNTAGEVDLPLFAMVLAMFDINLDNAPSDLTWGPRPTDRTIHLATAGLARVWRVSAGTLDQIMGRELSAHARIHSSRSKRHVRNSWTVDPLEWELVKKNMEEIIERKGDQPALVGADDGRDDAELARRYLATLSIVPEQPQYGMPTSPGAARYTQVSPADPSASGDQLGQGDSGEPVSTPQSRGRVLESLRFLLGRAIQTLITAKRRDLSDAQVNKMYVDVMEKVWSETEYDGPGLPRSSKLYQAARFPLLGQMSARKRNRKVGATSSGRVSFAAVEEDFARRVDQQPRVEVDTCQSVEPDVHVEEDVETPTTEEQLSEWCRPCAEDVGGSVVEGPEEPEDSEQRANVEDSIEHRQRMESQQGQCHAA